MQKKKQVLNLASTKWELLDVVNTFIKTLAERRFVHADIARNCECNRNTQSELVALLVNPTDQPMSVSY